MGLERGRTVPPGSGLLFSRAPEKPGIHHDRGPHAGAGHWGHNGALQRHRGGAPATATLYTAGGTGVRHTALAADAGGPRAHARIRGVAHRGARFLRARGLERPAIQPDARRRAGIDPGSQREWRFPARAGYPADHGTRFRRGGRPTRQHAIRAAGLRPLAAAFLGRLAFDRAHRRAQRPAVHYHRRPAARLPVSGRPARGSAGTGRVFGSPGVERHEHGAAPHYRAASGWHAADRSSVRPGRHRAPAHGGPPGLHCAGGPHEPHPDQAPIRRTLGRGAAAAADPVGSRDHGAAADLRQHGRAATGARIGADGRTGVASRAGSRTHTPGPAAAGGKPAGGVGRRRPGAGRRLVAGARSARPGSPAPARARYDSPEYAGAVICFRR